MRAIHWMLASSIIGVLLSACGGSDGKDGTNAVNSLVDVRAEPAGAHCANGGQRITSGSDSNGNGVLDVNEISSTSYVCNGGSSAGSSGSATLLAAVSEPPGANCPTGGEKITSGPDSNGDGLLDSSEVSSTSYVCNGSPGAAGDNGGNGSATLVAIVPEPAGTHCPTAGSKINSGLDSNGNGVLDSPEISSTSYVCNGSPGSSGASGNAALTSIVGEPAGSHCQYGGNQILAGLDTNGNGVLDSSETTVTSYVCNGAPGPGLAWTDVTDVRVQADSNKGYLLDNSAQVVITLPANPAVGDVIGITGVGSGGWKIAQNTGQTIRTSNLAGGRIGGTWTPTNAAGNWISVASSADGVHLLAATFSDQLYTSSDSGVTWIARDSNRGWSSVASSADGSRLVAGVNGGQLYTSSNSGITWVPRGPGAFWTSVASSADGTRLVAAATNGQLYTSNDGGVTWTPRDAIRNWGAVASSADGTRLVAGEFGGQLYTSVDAGVTWTARDSSRNWSSIASSADGTRLVAAVLNGQLYTSVDAGITWIPRESVRAWISVASSADGTRLLAADENTGLYTTVDAGATWISGGPHVQWYAVASSADGARLVAGAFFDQLYTSTATLMSATTQGPAGNLSGRQYDAVDLQYVGGGLFTVRDSAGVFDIR